MERERRKAYSSYRDDFIYNISDFEESTFYFDDFSTDSDVKDALIDEEKDLLDQEDLFNCEECRVSSEMITERKSREILLETLR